VWHLGADGTLRRIDTGDDALTADGTQAASAVIVRDGEVVIVGEDLGGVGMWRSTTLLDLVAG
jgi:predicted amidohydrolase YtcJ